MLFSYSSLVKQYNINVKGVIHVGGHIGQEMKTLEKNDCVYTEVNNTEVYEHNALIEEIDEFLKDYTMVRVVTDWMGGTWGDAFYIRQNLI